MDKRLHGQGKQIRLLLVAAHRTYEVFSPNHLTVQEAAIHHNAFLDRKPPRV